MNHDEFKSLYQSGALAVDVDKNKAGFMYQSPYLMPRPLRRRQAAMRTFAFGGFFLSIILFFIVSWWIALLSMFLSLFMFPAAQKDAAKGFLEASLIDPNVYNAALSAEVLANIRRV